MRAPFFRLLIPFYLVLGFCGKVMSQSPDAQIGTLPASQGGVVSICSGDSVMFQSLSTNVGLITTYNWDFGPLATPQTATGSGPHVVYFWGDGESTSVSLIVDNQNGFPSDNVSQPVVINSLPVSDMSLMNPAAGFSTDDQGEVLVFKKCDSTGEAVFTWQVADADGWSHSFQWGDGSAAGDENSILGNEVSHAYPIGQFNLSHTVVSPAGCEVQEEYIVFNGAAPLITVEGQGLTTCLPFPYNIQILSNEVPIDYVVSFSDGSASDVFSTDVDTTLAHVFEVSSCGVDYTYAPGFPPIQNAFSATLVAQNLCSVGGFPTIFTVGPITISTPAEAAVEQDLPNPICENAVLEISDVSEPAENISSTGCDSISSRVWQLPFGVSLESGVIGSFNGFIGSNYDYSEWTSGSESLELSFEGAGTYVLGLYVGSNCGVDSTAHVVEVKPTASLSVSNPAQVLCSGEVTTEVLFSSSEADYEINWSVEDYDGVSPVFPGSGSAQGQATLPFWFPENVGNDDGTFVVVAQVECTNDAPITHLITVGPEADVLASPSSLTVCSDEGFEVQLESNVAGASFDWEFEQNATIIGASSGGGNSIQNTLSNTSSTEQTVVYTIEVTDVACPGNPVDLEVVVLPVFTLPSFGDLSGCPGDLMVTEDVESVEGATWSWEIDNLELGLPPSGLGNVPDFNAAENDTDSPLTGNVTVSGSVGDCPVVEETYQLTVFDLPVASFEVEPNGGLHCITGEAQITGVTSAENSFDWAGEGILFISENSIATVNQVGNYEAGVLSSITGCMNQFTVEVLPPEPISISDVELADVSCYGGSDGSISVLTSSNTAGLTWEWTPPVSASQLASDLVVGSYNVLVQNASFCVDELDISLSEPSPIIINLVDSIASECGEANGLLGVSAQGGVPGYLYQWEGDVIGAVIDNIDAGNYFVQVEDQNGCSANRSFTLDCIPLIEVIPNEFLSPNGDLRNDQWIIENILLYPENEVWVYNRWGNLVHHAEPYENQWDGRFTEGRRVGEVLPSATYYFVIDTKKKSQDPVQGFLEIQSQEQ